MKFRSYKAVFLLLLLATFLGPAKAQQTQCVTNALAGGTVNAITVPLLPCGLATNLLLLTTQGANTVANPTLQMVGFPAQPLVTTTGLGLPAGALPAGVVLLSSTGTKWVLLSTGNFNFDSTHGLTATVASIAELQALGVLQGTYVQTATVTDTQGAGMVFQIAQCGGGKPSCTPDNGTTFAVGAGALSPYDTGYVWQRQNVGSSYTVDWFDTPSSLATDASAALTNALLAAATNPGASLPGHGSEVHCNAETYNLLAGTSFIVGSGVRVIGPGGGFGIFAGGATQTGCIFAWKPSGALTTYTPVFLFHDVNNASAWGITVDASGASSANQQFTTAFQYDSNNSPASTDWLLENFQAIKVHYGIVVGDPTPVVPLASCALATSVVTCNSISTLPATFLVGTKIIIGGTATFDTGVSPVTLTSVSASSFTYAGGAGSASTAGGMAAIYDNYQMDFGGISHGHVSCATADPTCEGIHINAGNGLQLSRIFQVELLNDFYGVNLIFSNGTIDFSAIANGGLNSSATGSDPTFFRVQPTFLGTYRLVNSEVENPGAFAYAVHDSSCSTGLPPVSSWDENSFNLPVSVDGCAEVSDVGTSGSNHVLSNQVNGLKWFSTTATTFGSVVLPPNPGSASGSTDQIWDGSNVLDDAGHTTTTTAYQAATSGSITLNVASTTGFPSKGVGLRINGVNYSALFSTGFTLSVAPGANIPVHTVVCQGVTCTYTTATLVDPSTSLSVLSTTGFAASGVIYIGGNPFLVGGNSSVISMQSESRLNPSPGSAWINTNYPLSHLMSCGGGMAANSNCQNGINMARIFAGTPLYSAVSASSPVACDKNQIQHVVLSANVTLTLGDMQPGEVCTVDVQEDGTGGYTPTFAVTNPRTLVWNIGGAQPVQGTTASTHYLWNFIQVDTGIVIGWYL